jgi:hypothetical protein
MVTFYFTVNRSFLNHPGRFITIPKTQVDYAQLERAGLFADDVTVICPNGSRMSGSIYHGRAGYGPYYQLRIHGGDGDPLGKLPFGQKLLVEIRKNNADVEVVLTDTGKNHR